MKKAILFCSLLFSSQMWSQEEEPSSIPWLVRRFEISAGLFVPINNTSVQVGTSNGNLGTTIDFEDDLGFSSSVNTAMAGIKWRISRRSRLDFDYYRIDRESHHKLEKTIDFGDNTFEINSDIYSFFDTKIYRLSYGYAILAKPGYELGLMIGAHTLAVDVGIGLEGTQIAYREDFNFTAPLPNAGIWGDVMLSDKWALRGSAGYLKLKINDISGRIIAYNVDVVYAVIPSVRLSLGYTGLNFDVNAKKKRLQGDLEWGYNGPSFTATYAFGKKSWPRHKH